MFSFPDFDDKSEKKFLKACENGDVDTAKTMIDQGNYDIFWGMFYAFKHDHIRIAELMITMKSNDITQFNYRIFMIHACGFSRIEIANIFVSHVDLECLNTCMRQASERGDLQIVKYLVSVGVVELLVGILKASVYGHLNVVEFIYEQIKGNKDIINTLNQCIECVYLTHGTPRNPEVVKFLIFKGANNLQYLKNTEDFKLYCIYCRRKGINPSTNKHMQMIVKKYPVYSMLYRRKYERDLKNAVMRLPIEMFKLLNTYF